MRLMPSFFCSRGGQKLAPINTVNRIPTINETTKCRLWVGFDQRLSAARPYPTIREGRSQCRSPPGPHASEMRGSRLLTDASSSNFLMWPRKSVPALAAKSICGVDERELARDMLLAQSRALLCSPPNAELTPPDHRGVTDAAVLDHSCTAVQPSDARQ